ncbi:MAG: hypothetical protein WCJ21_04295 [Planctomycetota bacterium]
MSEQIGVVLIFGGLLLAGVGLLGFLWRSLQVVLRRSAVSRLVRPLVLLTAGLAVGLAPFVYQQAYLAVFGLGERERIIDGQRALTLTGWDRGDYSLLRDKSDVGILEMGNADVTDDTLRLLDGFAKLQELTLNDSKITDAGLEILKTLPSLETLRLARTGITAEGVSAFLASPPPLLRQIDVSGNGIPTSILRRWKNAGNISAADQPPHSPAPPERQYVN